MLASARDQRQFGTLAKQHRTDPTMRMRKTLPACSEAEQLADARIGQRRGDELGPRKCVTAAMTMRNRHGVRSRSDGSLAPQFAIF